MGEPASIGDYDYIIVGAGSAGCLLANRLSADASVSVLLLEAGGKDDHIWLKVPVGARYTQGTPRFDWCFKSEPEPGLNGRSINIPRGRVLGGSSAINGMIYMRGQARDYDLWRQLGNTGWAWDDVLPYFKSFEDFCHGADEWHGAGGELRIEEQRMRWPILDAVVDAAVQTGLPRLTNFNRGDNEGAGYAHVTQRRGVRASASSAFLRPVMQRPNLRVVTSAQARRVTFSGRRATGVEFWQGDTISSAQARREVILAAGAIGSPQLLQVSGVGAPALLQAQDVDVVHALSGVGRNLQDHLMLGMIFKVANTRTLNERLRSPLDRIAMGLEYALLRTGPLSVLPAGVKVFARSDPSRETANIQVNVAPVSYDKLGDPPHPFPAFTAYTYNMRPTSRGHVHITGADARVSPALHHNYLDTFDDQRVTVDIIRAVRRIAAMPALAQYRPEEFRPGAVCQTDEDILAYARANATTVFHPVGTCKMGQDPLAVVDDRLRVHGVNGLRVADAAIMPAIVSGNTNAAVMMIAEKASAMILADAKTKQRVAA